MLLDPCGTVRAVTELSGVGDLTASAFLGRDVVEVAAERGSGPERREVWTRRLAHARDANGTTHYADAPAGSGAAPSVDASLTPVRRSDGTLEAILLVLEDYTQRVQTEGRLHESEERFRLLAELLPQMVWTSPGPGKVDYFSPRWAEFTGRSIEELLGTGYVDLIHPDDLQELADARERGHWERPVTFRLRRHDGEYRTMEGHVAPVFDEAGTVVRWVGGTSDITERRTAEDRSRETQEQLTKALEMTGLGRFTIELRPPSIIADDRVSEILGLRAADLIVDGGTGRLFDDIHEDDVDRVRHAFEASTSGGPDFDEEYRILRPTEGDPEERWIAVAALTEFDADGPLRLFGVIEDTTDRHRSAEARLRGQKREAIGTLAGGIAHDFNNVIGAILSNAALAETELDLGESPRTSVAEIRRGASRAADLVSRLLAFSREDEPVRAEVDLADVAREACALLRPTLPPAVLLDIEVGPGATMLRGDATQLHQVVMNLVTNAGQALGEGGGTITLSIARVVQDDDGSGDGPTGDCLELQVRDNGPGMPDEVRRRAFDPFFTTKAAGEGTGLGLAATQTIVRSHGGAVSIESVAGHHTTVTALFPADGSRPTPHQAEPASNAAAPVRDGLPPRVLFVDDEAALATLAARAMPAYGCAATVFTDPGEALGAFAAEPDAFDALVTDLSMPGLSGLELSEKIRELRPDFPIVLTSGFLTPDNEEQARRQGVNQIVAKPCSIDDLTSAVLRLVN